MVGSRWKRGGGGAVGGGVLSFLSGFRLLERNAIEVLNLKYSF